MKKLLLALALSVGANFVASAQVPQIIGYQGRVLASGTNFTGTGQFKFALVNATGTTTHWSHDGTATGEPATALALTVTDGLVSVLLGDTTITGMTTAIAPSVFASTDVRLRIWFSDGTAAFQQLAPDQRLAAAGYALVAATVPDAAITTAKIAAGAVASTSLANAAVATDNLADSAITTTKLADASVTTAKLVNAAVGTTALADGSVTTAKLSANAVGSAQLANASVASAQLDLNNLGTTLWKVGGNSGTIPAAHFLGTTDNQSLEIKVNSTRALRLEPNSSAAPNIIAGAAVNSVSSGAIGATIAGGGAGSFGGTAITNLVQSTFGTIGGGGANGIKASSPGATIAGGYLNVVSNNAAYATVGGGYANGVGTNSATVAGGYFNLASGFESTVGGGEANLASGSVSFIGGGQGNIASGSGAVIGGGVTNIASGFEATVGGGELNDATGPVSFVGGGYYNAASKYGALVGGGYANLASGTNSLVAGGEANVASGNVASVGGGYYNGATGFGATIPGGYANAATGSVSFAAGYFANAAHNGAFVWADFSSTDIFSSTVSNQFNVRATGGARFISSTLGAGTALAPGGGSFISLSDRNAKENFGPVDTREILEKVSALPVSNWNYRAQDKTIRHLGPMAQDFHAAFGIGESNLGITATDADGVALAAIQGLYQIVKEKNQKISDLERRLADLESKLNSHPSAPASK